MFTPGNGGGTGPDPVKDSGMAFDSHFTSYLCLFKGGWKCRRNIRP